jgi:hypothetical protein
MPYSIGWCETSVLNAWSCNHGSANVLVSRTFVGPNLTPDMETGLGKWTDSQIAAAIRNGLRTLTRKTLTDVD